MWFIQVCDHKLNQTSDWRWCLFLAERTKTKVFFGFFILHERKSSQKRCVWCNINCMTFDLHCVSLRVIKIRYMTSPVQQWWTLTNTVKIKGHFQWFKHPRRSSPPSGGDLRPAASWRGLTPCLIYVFMYMQNSLLSVWSSGSSSIIMLTISMFVFWGCDVDQAAASVLFSQEVTRSRHAATLVNTCSRCNSPDIHSIRTKGLLLFTGRDGSLLLLLSLCCRSDHQGWFPSALKLETIWFLYVLNSITSSLVTLHRRRLCKQRRAAGGLFMVE